MSFGTTCLRRVRPAPSVPRALISLRLPQRYRVRACPLGACVNICGVVPCVDNVVRSPSWAHHPTLRPPRSRVAYHTDIVLPATNATPKYRSIARCVDSVVTASPTLHHRACEPSRVLCTHCSAHATVPTCRTVCVPQSTWPCRHTLCAFPTYRMLCAQHGALHPTNAMPTYRMLCGQIYVAVRAFSCLHIAY